MKNILLIITLFITHVLYSQTYDVAEKFYSNGSPKVIKTYKETNIKLELIKKTVWYQDGYKKTVEFYKDGMLNGKSTAWYNNGQKEYEIKYKDGILNGKVTMWSESGSKLLEKNYNNGVLQGSTTQWYENGQKSYQGNYENAEQDGLWTYWYENGQKKKEETYKDGELYGEMSEWDKSGTKKSAVDYDDRICITTKFGEMVVELFNDVAPKHAESFKMHARNGYYDGTTFHRVIPGFVIQGGDPNSRSEDRSSHGMGGHAGKYYGIGNKKDSATWMLPAEFNSIKHKKGILSMARAQDPNSGSSQFFICVNDVPQLDNQYTVFGMVIDGLDVIDAIVNVPRDRKDNPNERIEMQVAICGEKESEETFKNGKLSPGITDDKILIGNVQDLSGPLKELGAVMPSGSNMYFQHINDQGGVHGRSIKMLIEDHQYNPQKAVAATKKLVEKDQVFCLFQVIGTASCEAIRPVLAKYDIPLIAPATSSGSMSDLTREAGDLIFHTDTGYDRQAEILVDYILEQNSEAKIGVVYQDDDYGENVLEGIFRAEEEHEITVQKEYYQRGAIDFKGQTMNLLKGGCTDVIIAGIVREPVMVMKTAEAMNYKPNFFGTSPTVDARVGKLAGSAGEGFTATYWANMWNSDAPGPILYRELCEKYDIPEPYIGLYHYYGFATAQLLVEGLERAGRDPTRGSLVRGLETLKNWDVGSFPPITFNRDDHAGVDKVQLVQIQNGEQVVITDWLE